TALPYGLLAAALAALWLARLALRGGPGAARRRALAAALAVGLPALAALAVAGQLDRGRAAGWHDARTLAPAPRAAAGGGYALVLEPGEEAVQALPDVATARLRNGAVRAGARVWGDGPVTGRLVVYTGQMRQEYAFAVERMSVAELGAAVPTSAPDVRLGIVAERGRLYAGDIWVRGVGLPGQLLANGDLARPALRPDSPLQPVAGYLRLDELLWVAQSGRLAWGLDLGAWWRWLFASFWGHFGWMHVVFVRGSLWEPAIAAMAALGLAGACHAAAAGRPARRGPALALLALIGLSALPLLANAMIDMRLIQQGRYLFPALPALAALMALGQAALVPRGARALWLACWLGFWLACAGAALLAQARFYYG
ncbi:MAG TPA: hypothetical protein PKD53_34305, partial [Chloroflexaceae bacterium]|nr:hypothetical protein [Chloroflexaceae bacterium]